MARKRSSASLVVILGNQLFPPALLKSHAHADVFMAEDVGLCTYVRHHKQKIVMFLAAMRAYRDALRERGFTVHYEQLDESDSRQAETSYETKLARHLSRTKGIEQLVMWEVEDRFFEQRLIAFAQEHGLEIIFQPSPMFLTGRDAFAGWLGERKPLMADFYRWQRKRLGVLMDADGSPVGGRWSFDDENRKRLPKGVALPEIPQRPVQRQVSDVMALVRARFADHPGELAEDHWWLATTRREALAGLRSFLDERFDAFGPYEDALSTRGPWLFHSLLSPALNLGLITPQEVLARALDHAEANGVRMNSLEGFVRQIIGWREFIRGVDRHFGAEQAQGNFFRHRRRLTRNWWEGTTGLLPMDDVIRKALRYGWTHHIERLMVAGNLMTLCEIEPVEAYRWFMEMFVDSSDWVMIPNVYGMGIFADGGVFSTKPYICGSNYILKMSDYRKPTAGERDWCTVMDGLYWRFIERNRAFFRGQARMGQAVATLDRMESGRRRRIKSAAERFLAEMTDGG